MTYWRRSPFQLWKAIAAVPLDTAIVAGAGPSSLLDCTRTYYDLREQFR